MYYRMIIEGSVGSWKRRDQLLILTYAAAANT